MLDATEKIDLVSFGFGDNRVVTVTDKAEKCLADIILCYFL